MDQNSDNRQKQILFNLLANPADTGLSYVNDLEQLVNDYPQSGMLRALLARTGGEENVKNAAVYFKAGTLHKLLNHPDSLAEVPSRRIISPGKKEAGNYFSIPFTENVPAGFKDQEEDGFVTDKLPATEISHEPEKILQNSETRTAIDEEIQEEIQDIGGIFPGIYKPYPEPSAPVHNSHIPAGDIDRPQEREYFRQDIDDEIYDEIVGIDDIGFESAVNVLHEAEAPAVTWQPVHQDGVNDEKGYSAAEDVPLQKPVGVTDREIAIDEEKLILGNIVSADYLSFDKKLDGLRNSGNNANTAQTRPDTETKGQGTVSRYNDDTMPYSFLWWLDKTRKEHAGTFQPYTSNASLLLTDYERQLAENGQPVAKPAISSAPNELQQQYYENIFSLTSVNSIERHDEQEPVAFDHNKKEDVIIERFIQNEPQIKPPAANKLDNENKAKKSSEDMDVLVTETLAGIYTDQMLYHKAIATYKKLILKFPEKKLYFVARMEELEKKTN